MAKKRKLSPFEEKLNDWVSEHLGHISFTDKLFFVDHLKTMVAAGLSIVEALDILSKEMGNRKFQRMLGEVKSQVETGRPLSEVLKEYPKLFPPIYVEMIAAGEVSGQLQTALEQITIQMKKTQKLISSIRGAMIYPAVVLTAMLGIGIMMATVVLPKLLELFKDFDAELPLATRILIHITNFMTNPIYMVVLSIGIFGAIILWVYMLKTNPKFKFTIHGLTIRFPIFGMVIKKINLARFSLTLSSLMKSAIPIIEAVSITAETCSNVRYQQALHKSSEAITSGMPLSEALGKYDMLFPPMVTEMILVGEKTGEIEHLLSELAEYYGEEVDNTMKNFSTIIEPILIIVMGVAVGGLAVAVVMPMFSLVQNF
jgi:type IV pilus assembly protein PilC